MDLGSINSIDAVVRDYAIEQAYDSYTPAEHRTWQSVTTSLESVLIGKTAENYRTAFAGTGMTTSSIPRLFDINESLGKFDWRAIVVEGFIPPDVFMALQANQILPITKFIRTPEQLGYTPIPDIVHEAAGHLPMLYVPEYRNFLARLGDIGSRVSLTDSDLRLYETQKHLAELEAAQGTTSTQIRHARESVRHAVDVANSQPTSAARKIARFHWWTVEYGLIESDHKIYGAGLLSSVSEVANIPKVPHKRLAIECCDQSFDIDHVQPFYYVADSWIHLMDELDNLEKITLGSN